MNIAHNKPITSYFKIIGALLPIFGSFLYYTGRTFIISFYETFGIPRSALNYSFSDHLYIAVESLVFLLAFLFTYFIYTFWKYYFNINTNTEIPFDESKTSKHTLLNFLRILFLPKSGDPQIFFFAMYMFMSLGLIYSFFVAKFSPNFYAEALFMVIAVFLILGFTSIMTHKPTAYYVKSKKRLHMFFLSISFLTVFLSLHIVPSSVGRFAGVILDKPHNIDNFFPKISLVSNKPYLSNFLNWHESDGLFYTNDELFLILENHEGYYIKKAPSSYINSKSFESYFISKDSINAAIVDIEGYPFLYDD
jgi:hypothetical protein